jgi:hypothetical protein
MVGVTFGNHEDAFPPSQVDGMSCLIKSNIRAATMRMAASVRLLMKYRELWHN